MAQPAPPVSDAPAVQDAQGSIDAPFDTASLLRLARERLQAPVVSPPERSVLEREASEGKTPGLHVVFLSLSRPTQPAVVGIGEGETVEAATLSAADDLRSRATFADLAGGRLKIDVAVGLSERETAAEPGGVCVLPSPAGIGFAEHDFLFPLEELVALGLLSPQDDRQTPGIQFYWSSGWRRPGGADGTAAPAGSAYRRVSYQSRIETADGGSGGGSVELHRGNRLLQKASPEELLQSAIDGGDYLLRRLRLSGEFEYRYDPRDHRSLGDYNLLRHAGTCYALLELQQVVDEEASRAWETSGARQKYLEGARRGIRFLLDHHSRGPQEKDREYGFKAIVSPGDEAKLGGSALTLLAMLKYCEVSGDERWLPEMKQLAKFLVFQQEPDGHFHSRYFYGSPDPEPFESMFYPGEAILALARLAKIDPEGPWLTTAKRGADWLIDVRDANKAVAELPHDHWLLMGLNELTALTDDPRYATHARKLADSICEAQRSETPEGVWVGTSYAPPRSLAARAEALVAMVRLAQRHNLDARGYRQSLQLMAAIQRRYQITPENALYLARPDQAIGGFRQSLDDWEVRIDDVQHNISALLGIRSLMLEARQP